MNKVEFYYLVNIVTDRTTGVTIKFTKKTFIYHVEHFRHVRQLGVRDAVSGVTLCLVNRIQNNHYVYKGAYLEYGIAYNTR